jgi:uncharacterized membrane protein YfcA
MWIAGVTLLSVVLTAIISGVIGMAGGMILMGIFVTMLSVPTAMILHGIAQATSNGSRMWILRRHIVWHVLPPYLAGAAAACGAFVALLLVPDRAIVYIMIGSFPWVARVLPALRGLNVETPRTAFACGIVVTAAQLMAGASGPLLDVFYLNTKLDRLAIVATKAITQTIGHLLKLGYYVGVIGVSGGSDLPGPWLWLGIAAMAVLGSRLGTLILQRISDAQFRRASQMAILALGAVCVVRGVYELMPQWVWV